MKLGTPGFVLAGAAGAIVVSGLWLILASPGGGTKEEQPLPNRPASASSSPAAATADPRLAELIAQLAEPSPAKEQAAAKLVQIGTPEALRALILTIARQQPSGAAYRAICELAKLQETSAARGLMDLLRDLPASPSQELHYKLVCDTIGRLATAADVDELVGRARTAPDPERTWLLTALASVQQPGVEDTLRRAAVEEDWRTADPNASISVAASRSLGEIGAPSSVRFLLAELQKSDFEAFPPAAGLRLVRSNDAVPLLVQVARGQEPDLAAPRTRAAAATVLAQIKNEDGWSALGELRNDSNPAVANAASDALQAAIHRFDLRHLQ